MASTTLTETVNESGYSAGRSSTLVYTRTNASAPEKRYLSQDLTTTPVQIVIPTNTQDVYIQGPSGNSINIVIAGDSGATAGSEDIPLHPTEESRLAVISGTTLLYMASASSTITGVVIRFE